MKRTTLTLAMAVAAVALAGCDRQADRYESMCREFAALMEKEDGGAKAPTENDIKREVEKFSALPEEEQDKLIAEAEECLRKKKIAK